jgi:hypothetical protein
MQERTRFKRTLKYASIEGKGQRYSNAAADRSFRMPDVAAETCQTETALVSPSPLHISIKSKDVVNHTTSVESKLPSFGTQCYKWKQVPHPVLIYINLIRVLYAVPSARLVRFASH